MAGSACVRSRQQCHTDILKFCKAPEFLSGASSLDLLDIQGLTTHFFTRASIIKAVDNLSLRLRKGRVLGLVGESGCGKTVTALSILNLVPYPGKIISGKILFEGKDLLTLSTDELRAIRGARISMIFQEPMTALNPVFTVGNQISEV